jgi:hypothetical protein
MKKIVTLSAVAFLSTAVYANSDTQAQIDALTKKLNSMEKRLSAVNKKANNDNIKFDIDFRTSFDNVEYETAKGTKMSSTDGIFSNRLWLGMGYAPTADMIFKGQLAYNKAFGAAPSNPASTMNFPQRGMGFDTFDWVSSQTLNDDKLRVREAYWLWTPKVGDVGFTLSVGRRPSTNGFLANLREDDKKAKSPLGHVINMEFDGASAGVKLDSILPGLGFKLCVGRGLTNAKSWANSADTATTSGMDSMAPSGNYVTDGDALDTVDMAGFIFVPYDDGQYAVKTTWYRGFNVPGLTFDSMNGTAMKMKLNTVGDMDGMAISAKVEGIGDEINDFLDETTIFASYAMSVSHPNSNKVYNHMTPTGVQSSASMLGSTDSETGNSIWVGAVMPNLTGGKFGVEYNQGSKYWRPFTYGEDTLAGSKLATRGKAYEVYWTQPLVEDVFSMQVRYTKMDYDYTGSNGFFGDGGAPTSMSDVKASTGIQSMDAIESASDLRVYFRYRY